MADWTDMQHMRRAIKKHAKAQRHQQHQHQHQQPQQQPRGRSHSHRVVSTRTQGPGDGGVIRAGAGAGPGSDGRARTLSFRRQPRLQRLAEDNGDVGQLLAILEAGAEVNAVYGAQRATALHFAAENGRFELCAQLLNSGAQIDRTDALGYSPLMAAVKWRKHDYKHVIRLLISAGADLEVANNYSKTALFFAAQNHDIAAAALLAEGQAQGGLAVCAALGANTVVEAILSEAKQKGKPPPPQPADATAAEPGHPPSGSASQNLQAQLRSLEVELEARGKEIAALQRELATTKRLSPMFPRKGVPAIVLTTPDEA